MGELVAGAGHQEIKKSLFFGRGMPGAGQEAQDFTVGVHKNII